MPAALSEIYGIILKDTAQQHHYLQKAAGYVTYWNKDFKDLAKIDVDVLEARDMSRGHDLAISRWLMMRL